MPKGMLTVEQYLNFLLSYANNLNPNPCDIDMNASIDLKGGIIS
jgi:hypothetical protein